jgi:hypothetical protein
VLVLRDGEFSVWCRYCQWRSPEASELALVLVLDHLHGEGGRSVAGDRAALSFQVSA